MSTYLIVNRETNAIVRVPGNGVGCWKAARYQTVSAAKSAITRMKKKVAEDYMGGKRAPNWCLDVEKYEIYSLDTYQTLDTQVERVNAMTGESYMEDVNTPRSCSPSSELYWSM